MIYKGSTKIEDIYFGSTKIAEIYKGSTLVYSSGGYPSGTVLFEKTTAGTYTLQVDFNCTVHLDLVGGGGGAHKVAIYNTNGSSGAYISGDMILTAGTYTIVIGNGGSGGGNPSKGGNSSFYNNIAGGGNDGKNSGGGTATVVTPGLTGQNGIVNSTVGWINGYGGGGDYHGSSNNGKSGYCKIITV